MDVLRRLGAAHVMILVVFAGIIVVVCILIRFVCDGYTVNPNLMQGVQQTAMKDEMSEPKSKAKLSKTQKRNITRKTAKSQARRNDKMHPKERPYMAEDSHPSDKAVEQISAKSKEPIQVETTQELTTTETKTQKRRAQRSNAKLRQKELERVHVPVCLIQYNESIDEQGLSGITNLDDELSHSHKDEKERNSTVELEYELEEPEPEPSQEHIETEELEVKTPVSKSQLRRARRKKAKIARKSVGSVSVDDVVIPCTELELDFEHSKDVLAEPKTPSALSLSDVDNKLPVVELTLTPSSDDRSLVTVSSHLANVGIAVDGKRQGKSSAELDANSQSIEDDQPDTILDRSMTLKNRVLTEKKSESKPVYQNDGDCHEDYSKKTTIEAANSSQVGSVDAMSSPSIELPTAFSWADDAIDAIEAAEESTVQKNGQPYIAAIESLSQPCLIISPAGIAVLQSQTRRAESFFWSPEHLALQDKGEDNVSHHFVNLCSDPTETPIGDTPPRTQIKSRDVSNSNVASKEPATNSSSRIEFSSKCRLQRYTDVQHHVGATGKSRCKNIVFGEVDSSENAED